MSDQKTCWVPCLIENSGFTSERKYEVDLPGGNGKLVGTAYIDYLRDSENDELCEDFPPYGETVKGFVLCRIIKKTEKGLLVEFPGSDVFHVPPEALCHNSE